MGNCCFKSKGYKHLHCTQEDRLNTILEQIVTKAAVDFSKQEIQDIESAVTEMLERIKTRINERGAFSISRLTLCGSIAEKTAVWKFNDDSTQPFIEFDFLAVLQADCNIKPGCQECFCVNMVPANLELLKNYHRSLYNLYLKYKYTTKDILKEFFTREANDSLASCGCLKVKYPYQLGRTYTFVPSSACSKTQQGCDKCTLDRSTGTLRVKHSVEIGGINKCSLIFDWTSKAKTLHTRDSRSLPKAKPMDNLTIHVDFLPSLEIFQSKQQSADVAACSFSDLVLNPTVSETKHYCYLVPKHCVVCDEIRYKNTWRRSGCRAEIDTVVNKMSDMHRKCYQVIKYLISKPEGYLSMHMYNYHLKVAVLHHNSSCSDASGTCAKCVLKVIDELLQAYTSKHLKSLHSQAKLLEQASSSECNYLSKHISILKQAICSDVPESDSVSSFLDKVGKEFKLLLK